MNAKNEYMYIINKAKNTVLPNYTTLCVIDLTISPISLFFFTTSNNIIPHNHGIKNANADSITNIIFQNGIKNNNW